MLGKIRRNALHDQLHSMKAELEELRKKSVKNTCDIRYNNNCYNVSALILFIIKEYRYFDSMEGTFNVLQRNTIHFR